MTIARELPNLIGESDHFLAAVERTSAVAHLNRPVLIIGERGTGKELIAARVHYLSPRWAEDYLALNCAAISEELLESEMFGHVPGAYTGAVKARAGRFEQASGGTLFLDELASMSMRLQEKLLRVIEYGEFERVGSSQTQQVDVRLVAAANVDLPSEVASGRFRADLLDRLSFEVITLPPLRERVEDIPLLAGHFAENMSAELEREHFAGFSKRAMATLMQHHWPGNVRELRNVVERAVYQHNEVTRPLNAIVIDPFESPFRPPPKTTSAMAQPGSTSLPGDLNLHIAQMELEILQRALAQHQHHQGRTARALGLSYDQLRHLLKKHDLGRA